MSKEERQDRKKRAAVAFVVCKVIEIISYLCALTFAICCIADTVYLGWLVLCMVVSAVGFLYCNTIAHKISYRLYKHGFIGEEEVIKLATLPGREVKPKK